MYKTVIFYYISCSRLREYFEKTNHRNTFVALMTFTDEIGGGGGGGGGVSLTTFRISEKLSDF